MKIRRSFVSNSSSSSFVVGYRGGGKAGLTKAIKAAFALPVNHPLSGIEDEVAECFRYSVETELKTVELVKQWAADNYGSYADESPEVAAIVELVKNGYVVATGSFESYGGESALESTLHDMDFDYSSHDLVVKHVGGH